MKKPSINERDAARDSEELRKEYRFDYTKAQPNRFAGSVNSRPVVVLLAADVAKVFKDSEAVNEALRALIQTVPRRRVNRRSEP